jgi:hypothetical protein
MLQRTGEAETITTHYLFALGIYRALYIPNWIYRYFSDGYSDPIAVVAGIIQTILYSDFFWIYYTKFVLALPTKAGDPSSYGMLTAFQGFSRGRNSPYPSKKTTTRMWERGQVSLPS